MGSKVAVDGKEKHTLQFIDVASDDSRRSTFHAICHEIFLRQRQERMASNLLFFQNIQCSNTNVIGKLGLEVLDELFSAPFFDVGNGKRLHGSDRASGCL